jgi:hypothetical protein
MDEAIIRACVLFFYVLLEDEDLVYSASEAVLTSARRKKFKQESDSLYALVIREATQFYLRQSHKTLGRKRPLEVENPVPSGLLAAVRNIKHKVPQDSFLPFVWREVVKAPPQEISEGLGLSLGTVDYRSHEVLKSWAGLE